MDLFKAERFYLCFSLVLTKEEELERCRRSFIFSDGVDTIKGWNRKGTEEKKREDRCRPGRPCRMRDKETGGARIKEAEVKMNGSGANESKTP